MNLLQDFRRRLTRRHFFGQAASGLGVTALASLINGNPSLGFATDHSPVAPVGSQSAAKVKRVIYLYMSGGPSHIDLFDYKPKLKEYHGTELPESVRQGQRISTMTSNQKTLECAAPAFSFSRHGQAGTWISELLPNIAKLADDIAMVKSMHTEAINHDPGITLSLTGSQQPGRPSFGSWLSYGLGSENENLPGFVVMVSQGSGNKVDQPLLSRLWGSGFLSAEHQGVRFRSGKDPVLYLSDPPGVDRQTRREMLNAVGDLNKFAAESFGDPEIDSRIAQYEMAFRMQTSLPELADLSQESTKTLQMYGIDDVQEDGGFARNCLLARRMVERDVRFVQLFHRGWDQHLNVNGALRGQCKDVDRPVWALVNDLKQRGLLDDTLIVWGGEFGRTVYSQRPLSDKSYGRDHHGRCFSVWLCGGGVKPGITYGETDDYCYNVTENPVHVHDLNATLLHLLGIDHKRLTFKSQGRDFRLTDTEGKVVNGILS